MSSNESPVVSTNGAGVEAPNRQKYPALHIPARTPPEQYRPAIQTEHSLDDVSMLPLPKVPGGQSSGNDDPGGQ